MIYNKILKRVFGLLFFFFIIPLADAVATDTKALYNKVVPSIVVLSVETQDGKYTGSGFFAIQSGLIVTCWHVIEGATEIIAKDYKGKKFFIDEIVDYDEKLDLAILKCDKSGKLLSLNTLLPTPGTEAFTVGSPQGLDFSFSNGVVSQIRKIQGGCVIQFTCPVSPGNSGCPLVNQEGKVIGIVTSAFSNGQNLNFAMSSSALSCLNQKAKARNLNEKFVNNKDSKANINNKNAYNKFEDYVELGDKYLKELLFEPAEKEFKKAISGYPEHPDVIYAISRLCLTYSFKEDYKNVRYWSEKGIQQNVLKPSDDKHSLADIYFYYAKALSYFEEYYTSIKTYEKAYDIYIKLGEINQCFHTATMIAFGYLDLKDKNKSEYWFNKALDHTNNPEERKEIYGYIQKYCYPK